MRATVAIIAITASAGLAVYGALERQAALKLNQENDGLRQRLSQMDKPAVETQRVSNLVADANGLLSQPDRAGEMSASTEEAELVRLRDEVKALRDQTREIENLQANTRELRAGAEAARKTEVAPASQVATTANGSQFEVLAAEYGTDSTNLDVAMELRARIRSDSLKAVASNNLKGDPDFGKVKHLTIVYRFRGVTMTNEFRENDLVILPKEDR